MSFRLAAHQAARFPIALAASLVVAVALVRVGPGPAAFLVALPLMAALIFADRYRALLAGVILALAIPSWWTIGSSQTAAFRLASTLALVPLLMAPSKVRFRAPDAILLFFVADAILSALLQTAEPGIGRILLNTFIPVAFYAASRTLPLAHQRRVLIAAFIALTAGALTVIVERLAGHVLFSDPHSYSWVVSNGGIFRPGGIYGSPPAASLALAIGLLLGISLGSTASRRQRGALVAASAVMVVALVLTFERSGMIALAVGLLVYLLLTRTDARTLLKYSIAVGLVTVAAIFLYPNYQGSSTFQNGVLRTGAGNTLTARTRIWSEELPIVTANARTTAIGVGFASTIVAGTGGNVPPALASVPSLISNSIHNQYLLILLEQGAIGLAVFLLFLGSVVRPGFGFAAQTRDRLTAGMTGSILAMMVLSLANTPVLDRSSWILTLLLAGLLVTRAGSTPEFSTALGSDAALQPAQPSTAPPQPPKPIEPEAGTTGALTSQHLADRVAQPGRRGGQAFELMLRSLFSRKRGQR